MTWKMGEALREIERLMSEGVEHKTACKMVVDALTKREKPVGEEGVWMPEEEEF